jgi:DNA polymerase-3 subunit delta'
VGGLLGLARIEKSAMVFDRILGQDTAKQVLLRALSRGHVHHAYRFEGPAGVGKELAAFALAQSLVCQTGTSGGCGACSGCHRAVTLSVDEPRVPLHPDVVLVGRGVYPKSLIGAREATGISVEQIRRVILGRVGYTPHEARSLVFIVRDADELTQSAANALLKTLEEPQRHVHFVLLTGRPHRLLDTIRSRSLAVRFGPLPDAALQRILTERGMSTELVSMSGGSAGAAIEFGDEQRGQTLRSFTSSLDAAVNAPSLDLALDVASKLPSDRHELRTRLLTYSDQLANRARQLANTDPPGAERKARQHSALSHALDMLERNVSPALTVEALLIELRSPHAAH